MGMPLVILGASGNAYDVLDVVDAINARSSTWEVVGFLDDGREPGTRHAGKGSAARKQRGLLAEVLSRGESIDSRLAAVEQRVGAGPDVGDLERALSSVDARRRLVVTDTVFSMQGDLAPVPDIARLCERHGAMLMVDDAHATGLVEGAGAGAGIVMSTLSKALGSAGGFVAGRRDVVEWLRNRARSYVFDTAPSPADSWSTTGRCPPPASRLRYRSTNTDTLDFSTQGSNGLAR